MLDTKKKSNICLRTSVNSLQSGGCPDQIPPWHTLVAGPSITQPSVHSYCTNSPEEKADWSAGKMIALAGRPGNPHTLAPSEIIWKRFLKVWYSISTGAVIGKYFWTTSSGAHKTLKSIKSTFRFSNKSLQYLMCSAGLQLEGLYCGPLFTALLQSRTFLCIQH